MTVKYTDAMVAEMKSAGSFTYDSAKAFADKYAISVRSVVAKLRALEVKYFAKAPAKTKTATDKPLKAVIVAAIEAKVGATLASLVKMTAADLEVLNTRLSA